MPGINVKLWAPSSLLPDLCPGCLRTWSVSGRGQRKPRRPKCRLATTTLWDTWWCDCGTCSIRRWKWLHLRSLSSRSRPVFWASHVLARAPVWPALPKVHFREKHQSNWDSCPDMHGFTHVIPFEELKACFLFCFSPWDAHLISWHTDRGGAQRSPHRRSHSRTASNMSLCLEKKSVFS